MKKRIALCLMFAMACAAPKQPPLLPAPKAEALQQVEPVEKVGVVSIAVVDDPQPSVYKDLVTFTPDREDPVELKGADPKTIRTGDRIRVRGWLGDAYPKPGEPAHGVIWASSITPEAAKLERVQQVRGTYTLQPFVIHFSGWSGRQWPEGASSAADVQALHEQVNQAFQRMSSGIFRLNVLPVIEFTMNCNPSLCDVGQMHNAARAEATKRGVDIDTTELDTFAFWPTAGNGWWGLGTIGGGNGSWAFYTFQYKIQVIIHELGHNLALFHSHACKEGTGITNACQNCEYCNYYDWMGQGLGSFNVLQLKRLGWCDAPDVPRCDDVTEGTFTLTPLADARDTKGLVTPTNAIEFRQNEGYGIAYTGQPYGAVAYLQNDDVNYSVLPTTSALDVIVKPGQHVANIAVTSGDSAHVEVQIGGSPPPPPPEPPTTKPLTFDVRPVQKKKSVEVTTHARQNGRAANVLVGTRLRCTGYSVDRDERRTGSDGRIMRRFNRVPVGRCTVTTTSLSKTVDERTLDVR